jgi:aminoglycoside 6'-N-acetyltransferase I
MKSFKVRRAISSDCDELSRMYEALWPEAPAAEYAKEIAPLLAGMPTGTMPLVVFVAEPLAGRHCASGAACSKGKVTRSERVTGETAGGVLAGFIEVGLRSHADGCDTRQPVGFLEGWFVLEGYRRQGGATQLLLAAEDWARGQGCIEMASDTWIDSDVSQRVHESLKFEVVDRCVHYRKAL